MGQQSEDVRSLLIVRLNPEDDQEIIRHLDSLAPRRGAISKWVRQSLRACLPRLAASTVVEIRTSTITRKIVAATSLDDLDDVGW